MDLTFESPRLQGDHLKRVNFYDLFVFYVTFRSSVRGSWTAFNVPGLFFRINVFTFMVYIPFKLPRLWQIASNVSVNTILV